MGIQQRCEEWWWRDDQVHRAQHHHPHQQFEQTAVTRTMRLSIVVVDACSMSVTMREEQLHTQHGMDWHSGTLDDP